MPLDIAQLGQPVLRQKAQPVPLERIVSSEFQRFLDDMIVTLKDKGGVGLAAPQVFRGERVFIAAILPEKGEGQFPQVECFINPELTDLSDDKDSRWEGCLSFLELLVLVPRHTSLRIDYVDRYGAELAMELSGFPARVIQHEFDHLEGILTLDRVEDRRNIIKATEYEAWVGKD